MMRVVTVMLKKVIFFFKPFQEKGSILLDLKASLFGKQNLLSRLHVCYLDRFGSHIVGFPQPHLQPWMLLGRLGYKSAGCAFFLARVCLPQLESHHKGHCLPFTI